MSLARTSLILALALALSAGLASPGLAQHDGEEFEHGHRHVEGEGDDHATVHHGFDGAERWSRHFDAPERDAWQRPDALIETLALESDAVVADLGAGTGYFAVRLARALSGGGRVLAVDIEEEMLAFIDKRAREAGLDNVSTILAATDDPRLEANSVDLVLCVNTWHHIDGRREYLHKLRPALREGGRIVIVDFREGDLPVGPPAGHKLAADKVRAEFEDAGFEPAGSFDGLEYQYVLIYAPGS